MDHSNDMGYTGISEQERMAQMKQKAAEVSNRAMDKAAGVAQGAADVVDEKRAPAAQALDTAASKLHQQADALRGGAQTVAQFTHRTADALEKTADYVRENDTRSMIRDTKAFVKEHPRASLAAAAAVGFLVGRALGRNR